MAAWSWALKDPFVFSIKAERGKRGKGGGGGGTRLPPVRSTLRIVQLGGLMRLFVFATEKEGEQACVGALDAGHLQTGSCSGCSVSPKCLCFT